jgi:WhiB family redox-sensing transcriptional regulator
MFEWMEFALCRGADPELWFPAGEPGSRGYEAMARRARGICADCPVRSACLDDALASGTDDGIWGGLDPAERRALAARVRAA